jgi:hypothetical protein
VAKKSYEELQRFILGAWHAESAERRKFSDTPPSVGPGFPHVSPEIIAGAVMSEIGSIAKSRRELIWRLKSIRYPYFPPDPIQSKASKTFYRHVRELRLLGVLTSPPILWYIRLVWFRDQYHQQETENRRRGVSQVGHPFSFHDQVMREIWRHRQRIERLARQASVQHDWLVEYLEATQKQILKEARNYYPEFLDKFKPAKQIPLHSLEVEMRVELFRALEEAFKKKNIPNHSLCYQLTALICTSHRTIKQKLLIPSPRTILTNVRDENKRPHSGKKSN